jgi:hypothetical protein
MQSCQRTRFYRQATRRVSILDIILTLLVMIQLLENVESHSQVVKSNVLLLLVQYYKIQVCYYSTKQQVLSIQSQNH